MATLHDLITNGSGRRVRAILNILVEAPYFYKTDNSDLFLFLRRYQKEFNSFFESNFGWTLVTDSKCARLYKPDWYNNAITPANRDMFQFGGRDNCIAFLLLLEFFEKKLEEESISIEDPENLCFRYGDLLTYERNRFQEIFPEKKDTFTDEDARKILREVMPALIKYRFLKKQIAPSDMKISDEEAIYECLPALWHYRAEAVSRPVTLDPENIETPTEGTDKPEK